MSAPLQVRLLSYGIQAMFLSPKQALPPVAWGPPGCAKTAVVREIVEMFLRHHLEHIIISDRNPEDIGGTPFIQGECMRRYPPDFVMGALLANKAGKRAVIFVDEMTTAQPPQQAPLMRLFHERRSGDTQLDPAMTAVCGAANPPDQAANGSELAAALRNRCFHIDWNPFDARVRTEWKMTGKSVVENLAVITPEAFAGQIELARAHICAFLEARPSLKNGDVAKSEGQGHGQFASDRMWDAFEALYAVCLAAGDEEAISACAEGTVGAGPGIEFAAWVTDMDLANPEDYLSGKAKIPCNKNRPDRTFAACLAVAAAATQDRPAKEYRTRWNRAWELFEDGPMDLGKDIAVVPGRVLSKKVPAGGQMTPEVQRIIAKLTPVIRESGLMS